MRLLLAVDAGGTSSRAVALDAQGGCLGYGRAGSGNPTATGIDTAVESIGVACGLALSSIESRVDRDSTATIALAGADSPLFRRRVTARLAGFGIGGPVRIEPDLLGMFHSGTPARAGYALVAGTGAVAARIGDGVLEQTVGGNGWLLGDAGSGFWIGRRIARAVVSELDGDGAATELTPLLLNEAGVPRVDGLRRGHPVTLLDLIDALYAVKPVELARFAPLAFRVPEDAVAATILVAASEELAALLDVVRSPACPGPIVVGGGILGALLDLPAPTSHRLATFGDSDELVRVEDGVLGACVLALRHSGVELDGEGFARLQAEVEQRRIE